MGMIPGGINMPSIAGQDLSTSGAPGAQFKPPLKPGQLPGQETVDVRLWTVSDVCGWLETLMLGQYKDAFADAAVDGPFLLELTEEDLLNTLGVEHPLHRKKIIAGILRLRKERDAGLAKDSAEQTAALAATMAQAGMSMGGGMGGGMGATMMGGTAPSLMMTAASGGAGGGGMPALMGSPMMGAGTVNMAGSPMMGATGMGMGATAVSPLSLAAPAGAGGMLGADRSAIAAADAAAGTLGGAPSLGALDAAKREAAALEAQRAKDTGLLRFEDLVSWIRHNKGKQVAEALSPLPDGRFNPDLVKSPFVPGFGTEYISSLDGLAFHVNKTDEHGNTLLIVAAQNNRLKVVQLLVRKGANPDHQNSQGNTAMHFAMAYKFHDLAAWLVDPEKGGASDEVHNQNGLDPYEGLEP